MTKIGICKRRLHFGKQNKNDSARYYTLAFAERWYAYKGAGYERVWYCKLPARIVELKRLGHNITSEKGTSTNRFGKVRFNIYKLIEGGNNEQTHNNAV